jgi:beta-galactosidase
MYLGAAWYPEHWPEERWAADLKLMREADMNVVRVGEFAWSRLEPADGQFEMDWLVRAVDMAAENGLVTVMGTPSAAPPAWLTRKHPDTLALRESGQWAQHGARCHYNPASPTYRELSGRVAEEMARRFGRHRAVVGWQIDNEFASISYDEQAVAGFVQWLKQRYGTLDELNRQWCTDYWSQTYSDWSQLHPPRNNPNPGLRLAWFRYCSDLYAGFQQVQIDAIRRHAEPRQWITHNFHPYDRLDRYPIAQPLDLVSWDAYVGGSPLDPAANGSDVDRIRGLQGRNIWIMETQPGSVNWAPNNAPMEPGAVRTMAWHMIGHGSDAVLYWQWRSALTNQEQYHGSVVAQDGSPRPIYDEIRQLGREFSRAGKALQDTTPHSEIAVIDAWADRWAIRWQPHNREFDPREHLLDYYRPLQQLGHTMDVLERVGALEQYRLVVAPYLHLVDDTTVEQLRRYVTGGGCLLLGPRSGFKDSENGLLPERQPGPLADLLGARVREFYALAEDVTVRGEAGAGRARLFAEWLDVEADDARVPARYGEGQGWLKGQPAIVTRQVGKGSITYVGAALDEALMKSLIQHVLRAIDLKPPVSPPEGVEVLHRRGDGRDLLIAVNHHDEKRNVWLDRPRRDILSDDTAARNTLVLPPLGVAVLEA